MISSYVQQGQNALRRWAVKPEVHRAARGAAHVLAGFCLSAASLEQGLLPLVLGLVCACRGWRAVLAAAGGVLGYGVLWGSGGAQGILWTVLALLLVLVLGERLCSREMPLLIPAAGMLLVSAVGLGFQILGEDTTSIPLYLIRVALGGAAPWLFSEWRQRKEPILGWLCWGLLVLGLAQLAPLPWLGLGYVAAGGTAGRKAFPCAAITGIALDLAGITAIPMTAVTALAWLFRFLPRYTRWTLGMAPAGMGLLMMYVCGRWDMVILPGLMLGGMAACLFADMGKTAPRRGETGAVQVRLELAAEVLSQARQLLGQSSVRMPDTDTLVQRAVGEACAGCSARDSCRERRKMTQLPGEMLKKPLLIPEELPIRCQKGDRVLRQLQRAQEQLRSLQADRQRQREYREALQQQYGFLERFLRNLADGLARRSQMDAAVYDPRVCIYGNREQGQNADRCMNFAGVENRYYIILCDGMGTGMGAVEEGESAAVHLRKLLSSGFPAEDALESLNSLCALRDRAACVTVDLAEVQLDTGKTTLYKWGAAASYLLGAAGTERLGGSSVPPGMSVTGARAVACSFQLKMGQVLLLVSDGVEEEQVMELCRESARTSPAALAEQLLQTAQLQEDATVVTVQLLYAKQE